jgi:hypothetical protein
MTQNIYALLVGIDTYHPTSVPAISPLKGCANDTSKAGYEALANALHQTHLHPISTTAYSFPSQKI